MEKINLNVEKIIVTQEVNHNFNWCWENEISQIKKDIEELEKLGATSISIEPYIEDDCSSVSIRATYEREETDEELEIRLSQTSLREQRIRQQELVLLAELKRKYENS